MAWRRPGNKPLSEQMMVNFIATYMHHSLSPGGYGFDFKCIILKSMVVITFMTISISIAIKRMVVGDTTDDMSALV